MSRIGTTNETKNPLLWLASTSMSLYNHRLLACFISLFILTALSLFNIRLFWCSLYKTDTPNKDRGHHGNSPDLLSKRLSPSYSGLAGEDHATKRVKMFLYVTQTEQCLPQHFLRVDQLGREAETFDILVLSWKTRCDDRNYHNVKYVFSNQNTTWSTGRNLLYSSIVRHVHEYVYYVFMDDDVMLYHTEPYQVFHQSPLLNNQLSRDVVDKYLAFRGRRLRRGDNPYREFERFLLEYQPAVGLLNLCFERREYCISQYVAEVWEGMCRSRGPLPFPFVSYSNFDGAFNAFHRDAITHLLPYRVTYEHLNWQESQKYLILEADIKFQGQVLYDLLLTAHGTKHRPYPRNIHWHSNWNKVLLDLRASIDNKYLNQVEVMPLGVSKRRIDEIRNPLPPRSPIRPYRHYEMNRTRSCHHNPYMYDVYNDWSTRH